MTKEAQLLIDRYEKLIDHGYWDSYNYKTKQEWEQAMQEKIKFIIKDQEKKEKQKFPE